MDFARGGACASQRTGWTCGRRHCRGRFGNAPTTPVCVCPEGASDHKHETEEITSTAQKETSTKIRGDFAFLVGIDHPLMRSSAPLSLVDELGTPKQPSLSRRLGTLPSLHKVAAGKVRVIKMCTNTTTDYASRTGSFSPPLRSA